MRSNRDVLLSHISSFNEKTEIQNSKLHLVARMLEDKVFIDENVNGIIRFYCRLSYSISYNRWDVFLFITGLGQFQKVTKDHPGFDIIDGSLDGAFNFLHLLLTMDQS